MRFYAIGYTLNGPGQNYLSLYEAIKQIGRWRQMTTSLWLVFTNKSAEEISAILRPEMDKNDELLVIRASDYDYCWFSDNTTRWIRENRGY